jgi:hypothetical protein
MHVKKIESLESRLARYEQERMDFVFKEALPILSLGVLVALALMFGINHWGMPLPYDNWLLVGAVVGTCVSIPPLLATMPKRPTITDVRADQSIRRAHGMDDTVDD